MTDTPEAFSVDEISNLAASVMPGAEPAPAPESVADTSADTSAEEAHAEGDEAAETEVSEAVETSAEEAQEAEPEKAKRKYVRKEERDRIAAQRDDYRRKAEELSATLERQQQLVEKLMGHAVTPQQAEVEAEDDEILDEVGFKKATQYTDERTTNLELRQFDQQLRLELASFGEKAPEVLQAVEWHKAIEAAKAAMRDGLDVSSLTQAQQKKYIDAAAKKMDAEGLALFRKGLNPLTTVYHEAILGGFRPELFSGKAPAPAKGADKPKVDMRAVEQARQEAGAPTHIREAVKVEAGDWAASIYKDAKDIGISDSYLRKLGLS